MNGRMFPAERWALDRLRGALVELGRRLMYPIPKEQIEDEEDPKKYKELWAEYEKKRADLKEIDPEVWVQFPEIEPEPPPPIGEVDDPNALFARAEQGEQRAFDKLRQDFPEIFEYMLASAEDMEQATEEVLIKAMAGMSLMKREALRRQIKDQIAKLCGPNPSEVERILAWKVALEEIRVSRYEIEMESDDLEKIGEMKQKRLDRAHKRLVADIKALAQIQKMGLAIQINMARQQVNIAGNGQPVKKVAEAIYAQTEESRLLEG